MALTGALDSFSETGGLLGQLHLSGGSIVTAEASAPAAAVNMFDKSEAAVGQVLAGAIVLQARGGRAFVIQEDPDRLWCSLAGGQRAVRIVHPTLNQALAADVMRGWAGYVKGAGKTGATFVVRGTSAPAEVTFETTPASAAIHRCVVRAPAFFAEPQPMTLEELTELCGLEIEPLEERVVRVDDARVDTLHAARGGVAIALTPGGRALRTISMLSIAAGAPLIRAGDAIFASSLVDFSTALCDAAYSRAACIAVGTVATDLAAGRAPGYSLGSLPQLAATLEAGLEAAAATLGVQWDSVLVAVATSLAALPARARQNPARASGSSLRTALQSAVFPAGPAPVAPPAVAAAPVSALAPVAAGGGTADPVVDTSGLSPDGARQLIELMQRKRRRLLDASLSASVPTGVVAPPGAAPMGVPAAGTGGWPVAGDAANVSMFEASFIPVGGEQQSADVICRELGGSGTRDAMAALSGRPRRASLAAGSSVSLLQDMVWDMGLVVAKLPGAWPKPASQPADWDAARDRLNHFDLVISSGQMSTTAAGRGQVHKVKYLGDKPTDEAVAQAASALVLAPLTEQRAFTLEQVASAETDAIQEAARICKTHGVSGWAAMFSSLQSDGPLAGVETHDGRAGDSLIPHRIYRANVGLGRWAATQVGLWNGAARLKFGTGASPLSVGTPRSEGAALAKRILTWVSRLQAGMVDQEEGVFLLGGETSQGEAQAAGAIYMGAAPSLGRPGSAPHEPRYQQDYVRFLTRLEFLLAHMYGRGGGGTLDARVTHVPHFGLAPLESDLAATGRSLWGALSRLLPQ